jgi:putative membrane protein
MDHTAHTASTTMGTMSILIGLFLLALLLSAYLVAAARQARQRKTWSRWRTLAFATGIILISVAISPPLSSFAHHDARGHAMQHLLIGMFAPLGLVLAAPITLLLRTVPVSWGRLIARVFRSRVVHFIGHPVTALLLSVGGLYLLYGTSLYAATLSNPSLHALVMFHFLAAGYLFAWAIAGPDPAPKRPGMNLRLGVLILAIAGHATLGKLMYAYEWPRGTHFDQQQLQAAAQLMYYGGDLAELLLATALFAGWYRHRKRQYNRLLTLPKSLAAVRSSR